MLETSSKSEWNRDWVLVIDAMAIRKQLYWSKLEDEIAGYEDFGEPGLSEDASNLASEAFVVMA